MLTAYDYPTAATLQEAGIPTLLVGDSAAMVVLGHDNTQTASLDFLITISSAVRRGAPRVFLACDIPYESAHAGADAVAVATRRFKQASDCDAVKIEVDDDQQELIRAAAETGVTVIAHLGLRPQAVTTPGGYRVQAREQHEIEQLVSSAQSMITAGAAILLLEAVPAEAAAAVSAAVDAPIIGCGAGRDCDGHVVVTHDMIGIGAAQPPRFVPQLADVRQVITAAAERWRDDIASGAYPGPEHTYRMRGAKSDAG